MITALALFVTGGLIGWAVGHFAMPLGQRFGLMDYPDPDGGRKLHAQATPLVGGLALVAATSVAIAAMLWLGSEAVNSSVLVWFQMTVAGLFLVGALDDRIGLTAPTRLAAASAFLLAAIAQVPDFSVNFLLFSGQSNLLLMQGLFGVAFTLLCFVGLLNAVNMADGKNGLVIGQAIVWAAVLMVRLPPSMLPLMAAIMGALMVLFFYNMQGKLFLGDGGSYGLSAMFGLLGIYAWNHGFADMYADDVALIFAVPVFDTLRLIVHRLAKGKSPFTPGRDHLHHYLYARWGWPRPLPWVLMLVAVPNLLAILLPGTGIIWLGVTLIGYLGLLWAANAQPRARPA
ncbi:glycosyltransferase family 4 protein [Sandaracinobacteroides hominis]|uniref:glycosyltransferase family 4 protein n=1 Tax=Sandaracinobacteroides hominis TaxID=2780086 RepID=UPI002E296C10|nr:MraY family glycosyltransferase [Sandaracinobacteroides hominis]